MKNPYKVILKNIGALVASTLTSRIVRFLVIVYSARIFGAEDFGQMMYILIIYNFTLHLTDMGIARFNVQQLSRDFTPAATFLGHTLIYNFLSGMLFIVIGFLYYYFWGNRPDLKWLALCIGLSMLLDTWSNSFGAIISAKQKLGMYAVITGIGTLITSSISLGILFFKPSLILFITTFTLHSLVRCILSIVYCCKFFIKPSFKICRSVLIYLLQNGIPFSLTAIFIAIYYRLDSFFLKTFWNSTIVGYYNAAYRLVEIPLAFFSIVTAVLFPAISHLYSSDYRKMKEVAMNSFKTSFLLGIPFASLILFNAHDIITIVYGKEYIHAGIAFQILIVSVAVILPNTILGSVLRAIGKQVLTMWVTAGGAVLNIVLNYFFVPRFSLAGAAATTLATELFIIGIYYYHTYKNIGHLTLPGNFVRIGIMNGIVLFSCITTISLPITVRILVFLFTYSITIIVLQLFDIKILLNLILRKKGLSGFPKGFKMLKM